MLAGLIATFTGVMAVILVGVSLLIVSILYSNLNVWIESFLLLPPLLVEGFQFYNLEIGDAIHSPFVRVGTPHYLLVVFGLSVNVLTVLDTILFDLGYITEVSEQLMRSWWHDVGRIFVYYYVSDLNQ